MAFKASRKPSSTGFCSEVELDKREGIVGYSGNAELRVFAESLGVAQSKYATASASGLCSSTYLQYPMYTNGSMYCCCCMLTPGTVRWWYRRTAAAHFMVMTRAAMLRTLLQCKAGCVV